MVSDIKNGAIIKSIILEDTERINKGVNNPGEEKTWQEKLYQKD